MVRRGPIAMLVAAALCALPAAAFAQEQPLTGWNGANPFNCALQPAGFGAEVPDPGADPYCVEFDKRRQNVTELGVVDFLSKEPARVAAAVPRCFYFQSDHWRGSVVQDDEATKTYEWDGHYFFDKGTGNGGVWVTNFNFNGHTADPSLLPGMPPEYAQSFGPGTGGVRTQNSVPLDPACAERSAREPDAIYARRPTAAGPSGGPDPARGCVPVTGTVGARRLGPVALGERDGDVRSRLGDPESVHRGFARWCTADGAALLVGGLEDRSGELGDDPDAPAVLVLTTSAAPSYRGLKVGGRARELARSNRLGRVAGTWAYRGRRGSAVLVGVRSGRVRWLALHDRRAVRTRAAAREALARALSG